MINGEQMASSKIKLIGFVVLLLLMASGIAYYFLAIAPEKKILARGETIFKQSCFVCHYAGGAGSPRMGDASVWDPRVKNGLKALIDNSMVGMNFMPPKGNCPECSREDITAAIYYMIKQCPNCQQIPFHDVIKEIKQ